MSLAHNALVPVQPERNETPTTQRHLRAVDAPARKRKPKVAYGLTALIGLLLIGAAQMGLSIATTATTYDIRDLKSQQTDLGTQAQVITEQIAGLSSPQYLAANAAASGMVVGASPTYLRLSDGAVVGTGAAAATSTVNVLQVPAVSNSLVANTPLVTAPQRSISGEIPVAAAPGAAGASTSPESAKPAKPPVITDGLPTPETR